MHKSLMFDEEKLASEIYSNGFTSKYFVYGEALLVAKYFRHTLKYGDARIKSSLILFCREKDRFFREIPNMRKIKRIVSMSKKEYINKSDIIRIYQEETDIISKISEYKKRRILFSILVLSKLNKFYLSNYKWNDIRITLHSKISNVNVRSLMAEFYNLGLVEPNSYDAHKILFGKTEGKIVFEINQKSIYNLNKVFLDIFGKDLFICCDCQNEYERKSYNQKRCKSCSLKKEKANWKVRQRKHRENMSHGGGIS